MIAWYYATALAKQWDDTIKILEHKKLKPWIHNKTIQKALESYRVTAEHKFPLYYFFTKIFQPQIHTNSHK